MLGYMVCSATRSMQRLPAFLVSSLPCLVTSFVQRHAPCSGYQHSSFRPCHVWLRGLFSDTLRAAATSIPRFAPAMFGYVVCSATRSVQPLPAFSRFASAMFGYMVCSATRSMQRLPAFLVSPLPCLVT